MGVLEEGAKAVGSMVDGLRSNPLALANVTLNICFLVFLFYYVSRISTRAEHTVSQLFEAQDKAYAQWAEMLKDTNRLAEKTMHCILPEDAIRLLQAPRYAPEPPQRPAPPAPLDQPQRQSWPPRWLPLNSDEIEWPLPKALE